MSKGYLYYRTIGQSVRTRQRVCNSRIDVADNWETIVCRNRLAGACLMNYLASSITQVALHVLETQVLRPDHLGRLAASRFQFGLDMQCARCSLGNIDVASCCNACDTRSAIIRSSVGSDLAGSGRGRCIQEYLS